MIKSSRLTLILIFLFSVTRPVVAATAQLQFPRPSEQFIVYYRHWPTEDEFFHEMGNRYRLIILNTDDLIPPQDLKKTPKTIAEYRKGRIRMLQDAGALVFGYLSIGEENIENNQHKPYRGDGLGPCSADSICHPQKKEKDKVASYYIDDGDGRPKGHSNKTLFVNAGNRTWRTMVGQRADDILALGCNGLFLDTLDTVIQYKWTQPGMIELLKDLNGRTRNIIVNRGLVFLENPELANDYKRLSWAVMFEDFYTEWKNNKGKLYGEEEIKANRYYWAPMLKGKNVLVVDFASCHQLATNDPLVITQRQAVAAINEEYKPAWLNYIADYDFMEIRYNFACVKG